MQGLIALMRRSIRQWQMQSHAPEQGWLPHPPHRRQRRRSLIFHVNQTDQKTTETAIMADKTELDSSLLDLPLPQLTKTAIASEYWASRHQDQRLNSVDFDLQSFWTYYNKECARALHNGGRYVALRSHRDVVDCIRKLKSGMLRHDIRFPVNTDSSHPIDPAGVTDSTDLSLSHPTSLTHITHTDSHHPTHPADPCHLMNVGLVCSRVRLVGFKGVWLGVSLEGSFDGRLDCLDLSRLGATD